jgi:hypothetical protein
MSMQLVVRLLLGMLLAATSGAASAQAGSCNCADARDLFTRHCAARAAIQEWDRLSRHFRTSERGKGAVFGATEVKDELAQCVDERISMVRQEGPGSRVSRGETDRECNVSVQAPNKCMEGVIRHHESFHKMMCEAHNRPDAPWRQTNNPFSYLAGMVNRLATQSAIDYIAEERTAYQMEVDYTRSRLEELAGQCNEPTVFRPTQQGRGFTLQPCPSADPANYQRRCTIK